MIEQNKKLISKFKKDIITLNNQRNYWLLFSSVIFVGVILTIAFSKSINDLHSNNFWWAIGSVGLIVSINWWYWTLSLIHSVLNNQINVIILLTEITTDVREIKTDVIELHQKELIK
jgi:hypothetical protein